MYTCTQTHQQGCIDALEGSSVSLMCREPRSSSSGAEWALPANLRTHKAAALLLNSAYSPRQRCCFSCPAHSFDAQLGTPAGVALTIELLGACSRSCTYSAVPFFPPHRKCRFTHTYGLSYDWLSPSVTCPGEEGRRLSPLLQLKPHAWSYENIA